MQVEIKSVQFRQSLLLHPHTNFNSYLHAPFTCSAGKNTTLHPKNNMHAALQAVTPLHSCLHVAQSTPIDQHKHTQNFHTHTHTNMRAHTHTYLSAGTGRAWHPAPSAQASPARTAGTQTAACPSQTGTCVYVYITCVSVCICVCVCVYSTAKCCTAIAPFLSRAVLPKLVLPMGRKAGVSWIRTNSILIRIKGTPNITPTCRC